MKAIDKVLAELRRPADKRSVGGHNDFAGFRLLLAVVDEADPGVEMDLLGVELPLERSCTTCRFMTPEFTEQSPCWNCMIVPELPKWRPRPKLKSQS